MKVKLNDKTMDDIIDETGKEVAGILNGECLITMGRVSFINFELFLWQRFSCQDVSLIWLSTVAIVFRVNKSEERVSWPDLTGSSYLPVDRTRAQFRRYTENKMVNSETSSSCQMMLLGLLFLGQGFPQEQQDASGFGWTSLLVCDGPS